MARHVFYSFHFKHDSQRVAKVKNMGVIEGQPILSPNDWEQVEKGGKDAIKSWIDQQMKGKSCLVVLIGARTAGREWVKYEIEKAWNEKKGVVGVYIHNLTDLAGNQDVKGANPFEPFTVCGGKVKLSSVVKAHDLPYATSANVYNHIKENLADWVEDAIRVRVDFGC